MLQILFALLTFSKAFAGQPLAIVIDPGHGGKDHGAVQGDVHECDITLAISKKLFALLQKDKRFKASMTREGDQFLQLSDRANKAKPGVVDLFLSIHVNSSPDKRAHGAEFYFQNQLPPDEESMFLAHKENLSVEEQGFKPADYEFLAKNRYPAEVASIVTDLLDGERVQKSSELSRNLKLSWRGSRKSKANSVRQAPFFVLSQMRVPSTLVEVGFLTNAEELADLVSEGHQARIAQDLYNGLTAYLTSAK